MLQKALKTSIPHRREYCFTTCAAKFMYSGKTPDRYSCCPRWNNTSEKVPPQKTILHESDASIRVDGLPCEPFRTSVCVFVSSVSLLRCRWLLLQRVMFMGFQWQCDRWFSQMSSWTIVRFATLDAGRWVVNKDVLLEFACCACLHCFGTYLTLCVTAILT